MSLQVLIAAESLVASGVVALAHGTSYNVDAFLLVTRLSRGANLGTLELVGLALNLMEHHLAVRTEAVGRRGRALQVVAANGRLGVTLEVKGLKVV